MSYIMVVNKSAWPIHGALSWATVQQQCFNDLNKGASHDFVVALGWHDLTVVAGSQTNKFDPKRNNSLFDVGALIFNLAALTVPGAAVALAATQLATGGHTLSLAPPGAAGKVAKVAGKELRIAPVRVPGLYAPDGYTVTITGGQVDGSYDPATETYTITSIKPLSLHWENRTSHTNADVVGRVA